ncbi:MAG: NlpC/P60 family protein [Ignavibacteriaceae bacterium]
MKNLDSLVNEVRDKYAPDKRVALFNVVVSDSSGEIVARGETNIPEAKIELMNKFRSAMVEVRDSIKLLPSENLKGKTMGIINLSVANLRTKPGHSEEMATQSLLGTVVNILKNQRGYYLVQTPDNYIAYIDGEGVEEVTPEFAEDWKKSEKIVFTKVYGFAYEGPGDESPTVSDLVIGNILKLAESPLNKSLYYKVLFPDGRKAFVKKSEAMVYTEWLAKLNPTQDNILKTAKLFMGVPYLWGGTSAKGLDCSGFTKTVYFLNGILLERDASQQVNNGEFVVEGVDVSKLEPGDLLFFGSKATADKKERVTHVAIYIGDSEYIHASGRVRINSLDPEKPDFVKHRYDTLIRVKRILSSVSKNGIELIKDNKFYR